MKPTKEELYRMAWDKWEEPSQLLMLGQQYIKYSPGWRGIPYPSARVTHCKGIAVLGRPIQINKEG